MGELRGFTCDGGCGAQVVLPRPSASLHEQGWWSTFTPPDYPTVHACSGECLIRAIHALVVAGPRALPK